MTAQAPRGPERRNPALLASVGLCVFVGGIATGLGVLASLLVPEGAARGVVWAVVAAAVAAGAGLWYGLTSPAARRRRRS